MKTKWIALFTVLALTASCAWGQLWKDGPHAGFATGDDVRKEEFAFGWQMAYEFDDVFSLELSATRQTDEVEKYLDDEEIPAGFIIDLETYAIALTGRASYQPFEKLRIHVGAGLGYYIMKTDSEKIRITLADRPGYSTDTGMVLRNYNADVDNDFGWHVAGGLEISILDNWELFAEYRQVFLEPEAKLKATEERRGAPQQDFLRTILVHDKLEYDHGLVRVGLNYLF